MVLILLVMIHPPRPLALELAPEEAHDPAFNNASITLSYSEPFAVTIDYTTATFVQRIEDLAGNSLPVSVTAPGFSGMLETTWGPVIRTASDSTGANPDSTVRTQSFFLLSPANPYIKMVMACWYHADDHKSCYYGVLYGSAEEVVADLAVFNFRQGALTSSSVDQGVSGSWPKYVYDYSSFDRSEQESCMTLDASEYDWIEDPTYAWPADLEFVGPPGFHETYPYDVAPVQSPAPCTFADAAPSPLLSLGAGNALTMPDYADSARELAALSVWIGMMHSFWIEWSILDYEATWLNFTGASNVRADCPSRSAPWWATWGDVNDDIVGKFRSASRQWNRYPIDPDPRMDGNNRDLDGLLLLYSLYDYSLPNPTAGCAYFDSRLEGGRAPAHYGPSYARSGDWIRAFKLGATDYISEAGRTLYHELAHTLVPTTCKGFWDFMGSCVGPGNPEGLHERADNTCQGQTGHQSVGVLQGSFACWKQGWYQISLANWQHLQATLPHVAPILLTVFLGVGGVDNGPYGIAVTNWQIDLVAAIQHTTDQSAPVYGGDIIWDIEFFLAERQNSNIWGPLTYSCTDYIDEVFLAVRARWMGFYRSPSAWVAGDSQHGYQRVSTHDGRHQYTSLPFDCSTESAPFLAQFNTGEVLRGCSLPNRQQYYECHEISAGSWDTFLGGFGPRGEAGSYTHNRYSSRPYWAVSEEVTVRPTFCVRATLQQVCQDASPTGSYMNWPNDLIPSWTQD